MLILGIGRQTREFSYHQDELQAMYIKEMVKIAQATKTLYKYTFDMIYET